MYERPQQCSIVNVVDTGLQNYILVLIFSARNVGATLVYLGTEPAADHHQMPILNNKWKMCPLTEPSKLIPEQREHILSDLVLSTGN